MEINQRTQQLRALGRFLTECEAEIIAALKSDLGKPTFEASAIELGPLHSEIAYALKNLARWAQPVRVQTPMVQQLGHSYYEYRPLGHVLIIAPWNYPFQLTLGPLISAVAAGNAVTLKPSELVPESARVLAQKLPRYLDVEVHEGGPEITTQLLEKRWDHIFFTGSTRVGRIILEKASKHLTPVTLELGGKCPSIVAQDANLDMAARRIAWGKFINAGQTCVAPDYVLAHESIKTQLLAKLHDTVEKFFTKTPIESQSYARIINEQHIQRLVKLYPNGAHDISKRYFAPTIVELADANHPLMSEEIFGPILPVLSFSELDQALEFVRERPKPLAVYYFSESSAQKERVRKETDSGAVCFNDTVSHLGVSGLPFGGVGDSGFGAYHGRWGFERFSHARAVYQCSTCIDLPIRYAPYSQMALKIAKWFQG